MARKWILLELWLDFGDCDIDFDRQNRFCLLGRLRRDRLVNEGELGLLRFAQGGL